MQLGQCDIRVDLLNWQLLSRPLGGDDVSKVQAAVQHSVPVLLMGGSKDDYETVPIKQLSAAAGCMLQPSAMSLCNHISSITLYVVWSESFSSC